MAKILIFIGAHLCTAPRPQKEAAALAQAGHEVTLCGIWFDRELAQRDQALIADQPYRFQPILDFRPQAGAALQRFGIRIQARLAREAFRRWQAFSPALLGYGARAMYRRARQAKADLNIFHSEAGLWAGAALIKAGVPVGIDFEDWFSDDLLPSALATRPVAKIRQLESTLMHHCRYKLTTSHALAAAFAQAYQTAPPAVIYNAFPRSEGVAPRPSEGPIKLHWFSHTIGPGRGLETLFQALPAIHGSVELHLRGNYPPSSQAWMEPLIPQAWRSRILIHPLVTNAELPHKIAEHDIGLALETPYCGNKQYTISNKLFQYLQSGLATIATDTAGQREIMAQIPAAGALIPCDDPVALATAINGLGTNRDRLQAAKQAAYGAAQNAFCYETQIPTLLNALDQALAPLHKPRKQPGTLYPDGWITDATS
ncbi:glycosyltransferase [Lyngbya confervoides]|uniref:Glycosyltransferase n=1 Tax=Lyngbya confervoides BDU141951 TaxID=1574623 RepID=A0ABD4SZF2_9CYAN|nr:glycosyltransferase [Lyngbya confervoides]MCM1981753.1 glycosyltransferase [Lyngbya confervoides BDU141951]